MTESELQQSLFAEIDLRANQDPRWARIFHVPNGGDRDIRVAARLKAQGVRRGVGDLWWPLKAHGYVGLVMELKVGRNHTTPEQEDWLQWLSGQGWYARVVRDSADGAMNLLQWYLGGAR